MVDGHWNDPGHLPQGSPHGGVNMEDHFPGLKYERQLPHHWVGGGLLW